MTDIKRAPLHVLPTPTRIAADGPPDPTAGPLDHCADLRAWLDLAERELPRIREQLSIGRTRPGVAAKAIADAGELLAALPAAVPGEIPAELQLRLASLRDLANRAIGGRL